MIAGVPGAGLNGALYLSLAVWMPFRELWLTLNGRSSLARWRLVLTQVSIAGGIFGVLWAEFWALERIVGFIAASAPSHLQHQTRLMVMAQTAARLGPQLTYIPFILLGIVVGSVQVLRLSLWLGSGMTRSASLKRAGAAVLVIAMLATAHGCVEKAASSSAPPVATDSGDELMHDIQPIAVFQPPGYEFTTAPPSILAEHDSLEEFYQAYFDDMTGSDPDDSYGLALANQILGLIRNDPAYIARARALFARHRDATTNPKERELAGLGVKYCEMLLTGQYPHVPDGPAVVPIQYRIDPPPTGEFHHIILGRSVIHITRDTLIKTQVDRVTRDWLEAHNVKGEPWSFTMEDHVPWHEGEKLALIVNYTGAKVVPVWGMKATKVGEKWYAPDATGTPRFEISEDKVNNYPSTVVIDDHHAIVNDTHGISAIAWDALDANLVVGCGDHRGKMDAAFYLADKGIDVFCPFDRFMGFLIGAHTQGTIIGSGPIHKTADGAEIGNQSVSIDLDEPIVVSNAPHRYPLQYYDTPYRYFTLLSAYIHKPLRITDVQVTEYGKAMNVVEAARKAGAKVLGIRVKSVEEHDAVAAWLKEDKSHRAILFHSAGYPDGFRLFAEFPRQTSFGDIHPAFE
jgi:hypothetical protein